MLINDYRVTYASVFTVAQVTIRKFRDNQMPNSKGIVELKKTMNHPPNKISYWNPKNDNVLVIIQGYLQTSFLNQYIPDLKNIL